MALHVKEAVHDIEREITIKSRIQGFPDRIFIIGIRVEGMEIREKGTNKYRKLSYDHLVQWMYLHCTEVTR